MRSSAWTCLASTRSARLTALAWTSSSFSGDFVELIPPDLAFCSCLGSINEFKMGTFSKFKGDFWLSRAPHELGNEREGGQNGQAMVGFESSADSRAFSHFKVDHLTRLAAHFRRLLTVSRNASPSSPLSQVSLPPREKTARRMMHDVSCHLMLKKWRGFLSAVLKGRGGRQW